MTDILTHARPPVRSTGPSAVSLVGLEIRKSLSTRSGKAVALAGVTIALWPPRCCRSPARSCPRSSARSGPWAS